MPDIRATSLLGLAVPNVLRPLHAASAGRLIWSLLLLGIGVSVVLFLCTRPKSPEPATWAQSMGGAVIVFALMILAYGNVPHEWLNFASTQLHWGKDTYFVEASTVIPFNVTRQAGADAVAALIYVFMLTGNVFLFALWQKRKVAAPPVEGEAPAARRGWLTRRAKGTSAYGRPLTVQE